MPTQDLRTFRQIRTIREDGQVEFVARDAVIQPDRHSFANQDELNAYLVEAFGGKVERGGIVGRFSRTGRYVRQSTNDTQVVTFGDPVLDTISSADGKLVIGGQTIDLLVGGLSTNPLGRAGAGGVVALDAQALKMTGIVHDAERWAADDGSYVEYRIRDGRLGFHAWKDSFGVGGWKYWSMGVEISVWNTLAAFEAANITSVDYMSVDAPCQQFNGGVAADYNDFHVDRSDWGFHSQQPERVAGLCQAQWHHRQFADLVTAGDGCLRYKSDTWPIAFPTDWTAFVTVTNLNGSWTDGSNRPNAVISVTRRSFLIDMSAFGRPTANGTVVGFASITATFPDDKTYTGQLSQNTITWSNGSTWTKVVNTVFDLNGSWTDGSPWIAVIFAGPATLTVDMSDFDRPSAQGHIINSSTIAVTFPDDKTYTGTLVSPRSINWSNGSSWTKKNA
jgi:hypothetical protein